MFSRGGAKLGLRPRREDRHMILVVAAVGVVSGYAIFQEPLRRYHEAQASKEAAPTAAATAPAAAASQPPPAAKK